MLNTIDRVSAYRTLTILSAIVAILFGCMIVLHPFIPALLLATIFCLSTWPAYVWLERKLGNRTAAAALMTVFLAVCFLLPLIFLGSSMAEDFGKLTTQTIAAIKSNEGHAPLWAAQLPWVGDYIEEFWQENIGDKAHMIQMLQNYAGPISQRLIGFGTSLGHGIMDLSLGVLIAFFFFRNGVEAAQLIQSLIEKFVGTWGQHLLGVSKNTMIAVVYGILGTALFQGALAAIGFWIANVPAAAFLGFVTFILSFVPGGFPLVLIPVTIWLFHGGHIGMAIFMAIWGTVIITVMDFIVRPYFISLGSSLPLLLVLLGVFGGMIAFGFIGLFIGPTLLAVAYALIQELGRVEKQIIEDSEVV